MALTRHTITSDQWTEIAADAETVTFQNVGTWDMYVGFSASNTAPSESVGLLYSAGQGELKKSIADLSFVTTPTHVYARSVSQQTTVIAEGT